jgi:hypothetical protein
MRFVEMAATMLCIFFAVAATASAQQLARTLSIEIAPQSAPIHEKLTATLKSPVLDTNTTLIVWKLNGVVLAQGIGQNEVTFTLDDTRQALLEATVAGQDGFETTVKHPMHASDIDLLWEGISYTPPTYQGRALVGPGGKVKVTAVPHVASGKPTDIYIYSWQQDGKPLQKMSGFGKTSATVQMPPFGDASIITVDVQTLQGDLVGSTGIRITPTQIRPEIYEQRPLTGLWLNTNIAHEHTPSGEISLRILPYFVDGTILSQKNTEIVWSARGGEVTPGEFTHALFRPTAGNIEITAHASQKNKFLQSGSLTRTMGVLNIQNGFGI